MAIYSTNKANKAGLAVYIFLDVYGSTKVLALCLFCYLFRWDSSPYLIMEEENLGKDFAQTALNILILHGFFMMFWIFVVYVVSFFVLYGSCNCGFGLGHSPCQDL